MINLLKNFYSSKIGLVYFKLTMFSSDYLFSGLVLLMRLWMARIFWYSGLTKIASMESTIYLFKYEYKVPLIDPAIAAYLSTTMELTLPWFLIFGLFTRLAALPLIAMTAVIEFTYLDLPEHIYWFFLLTTIVFYGAGKLSIDHLICSKTDSV